MPRIGLRSNSFSSPVAPMRYQPPMRLNGPAPRPASSSTAAAPRMGASSIGRSTAEHVLSFLPRPSGLFSPSGSGVAPTMAQAPAPFALVIPGFGQSALPRTAAPPPAPEPAPQAPPAAPAAPRRPPLLLGE